MLICKTPFRISLFGGGTDFPQWYNQNNGLVISYTIDKYCYVTLRKLPNFYTSKYRLRYFKNEYKNNISQILHPSIKAILSIYDNSNDKLEIIHSADIPGLSGLASSSAFTVSFLNLILNYNKKKLSNLELGKLAIDIEQNILKESVGSQDQIACAIGGFNKIYFKKNKIIPIGLKKNNILSKIVENSLIVYTGAQRKSNLIEKDKIKKIKSNYSYFKEMFQIATEAKNIIQKNSQSDFLDICKLMRENWKLKRKLSKLVSSNYIDNIYNFSVKNGAIAGKLLGAGGGGFLYLLTKNKKDKKNLKNKLKNLNIIDCKPEEKGTHIVFKDRSDFY